MHHQLHHSTVNLDILRKFKL